MLNKEYDNITKCRICGSGNITPFLFLGEQPLANSLKENPDAPEKKYPLTLAFCPKCSLVQLKETVRKEVLFDNYVWVTGTSDVAKKYAGIFSRRLAKISKIKKGDLILEIASNDGIFLRPFLKNEYDVIGIEPAKNIAGMAEKCGIKTINAYWDRKTAGRIASTHRNPKVIIARNVIPHVSELHEVIEGIRFCLADDGTGAIEFHYAGKLLKDLHYDSIYHEHLCYFSIASIENLLNKFTMFPFHIDSSPISGGSYVVYFSKKKYKKTKRYQQFVKREKGLTLNKLSTWKNFAKKCIEHREKSRQLLRAFAEKTIIGFGASARSSTYFNFCGFTNNDIKAIIDNNPLKQGLYSAGSSIPIVPFKKGFKMKPKLLFIAAWNFKDEIIEECRAKGYKGNYLIPFPRTPHLTKKEQKDDRRC